MPPKFNRSAKPMINSMTAFARVDVPLDAGSLQWEIRCVNHRHLEPQFRLPDAFRDLELPLRDLVRSRLKRGKVDSTLRIASGASPRLEIDQVALGQLLAALDQLRTHSGDVAPASALEILRWPGVLVEPAAGTDSAKAAVMQGFDAALDALEGHRRREGAMLGALIATKLSEIERLVAQLRPIVAGLPDQQRQRLQGRLADLEANVDSERLEQEVALLAQRSDVTEELDRLDIHVTEARSNLAGPGPHGRHLDFLLQELNREANTLASKSVLAETTQRAIDLKVIIEQIREQAQNIE
jgi:uncharacterized protein (TIGR00255 family)